MTASDRTVIALTACCKQHGLPPGPLYDSSVSWAVPSPAPSPSSETREGGCGAGEEDGGGLMGLVWFPGFLVWFPGVAHAVGLVWFPGTRGKRVGLVRSHPEEARLGSWCLEAPCLLPPASCLLPPVSCFLLSFFSSACLFETSVFECVFVRVCA